MSRARLDTTVSRTALVPVLALFAGCASAGQVERVEETPLAPPSRAERELKASEPGPGRAASEPVADRTARGTAVARDDREAGVDRGRPTGLETIYRPALDAFLQRGPGYLLAGVPVRPAKDERGRLIGFEILEVFGEPQMRRPDGVRAGDVLLRAQGRRVVTPDDLIAVYASLRTASSIDIDVLRAGNVLQLRWPVVALDVGAGR